MSIRIVCVDDHPIFRDGLRRLLEAERDFAVVGEAASVREGVDVVATLHPDVLLLDMGLQDGTGLDVLAGLNASGARVRTILLTAAADRAQILQGIKLGAHGLVLKQTATTLLYKAIRCVMSGEYWFARDQLPGLIDTLRKPPAPSGTSPLDTLTPRELAVIAVIVEGGTNRDVSRELKLSEQTVKNHLSHIYDKVGVSSRLELAVFAIHHNLLHRHRPS
jgi:DNA-binding NarL/FixJ family response regulator